MEKINRKKDAGWQIQVVLKIAVIFCSIIVLNSPGQLNGQDLNVNNSGMSVLPGTFVTSLGGTRISNTGLVDNSGTIITAGDWINNGTGLINGSPGTVEFNGSSVQTIGGSVVTVFNNLTINNSAGVVLTGDIIVNGTLTFTSGKITTGSNFVILGSNATVAGAGSGQYVNGNMRRDIPAVTNLSIPFDIGDASNYTPVTLDFVGTTSGVGSIDASTVVVAPPVASGLSQTQYVNREWILSNNGVTGFASYSPTFTFINPGDLVGTPSTSALIIRKSDSGVWSTTTVGAQNSTNTQCTGLTLLSTPSIFAIGEVANPPTVTCPSGVTVFNTPGICGNSSVSFGAATSSSLPAPIITSSHNSGDPFPVGITTVTVTVTNINGTGMCTFDIEVIDNENPTIICPPNINPTTNTGCTATGVDLGTPITGDNCSVASVTNDHPSTTYPLGVTTVIWTVTDGAGNSATCSQTVTVIDNLNPTIICPSDITTIVTSGCTSTGVSLGTPTVGDNCSVATVVNNHPSTTYSAGITTVIWTVTDGSGNTSTCTQTVTVTSQEATMLGTGGWAINHMSNIVSLVNGTDFGDVNTCATTLTRTFTLKNSGTTVLSLTGVPKVQITGLNAADFTVIQPLANSLAPGASTSYQVIFDPSALGYRNARVNVLNDDCNESNYWFAIRGNGTTCSPILVPDPSGQTQTSSNENQEENNSSETSSVNEITTLKGILYPNPNYGIFTLELSEMPDNAEFRLMDALGQVIYTTRVMSQSMYYDFSYLRAGTYYIRVISTEANFTKPFIITHKY